MNRRSSLHLVPLLLTLACLPARASDETKELLAGVTKIAAPGVPGPLCVFGKGAFALVTGGPDHEAVVAAARWGSGRVVAFGHTGYFGEAALLEADTGRLIVNSVRWAAGPRRASPRIGVLGQTALTAYLAGKGLAVETLAKGWRKRLKRWDVLVVGTHALRSERDLATLSSFVRRGGGLLAGGLGWGWLQLNKGKRLAADHPGNRLLAPAGIVWADGTLGRTADVGFRVVGRPLELANASRALDLLVAQARGKAKPAANDVRRAAAILTRAARWIPAEDRLLLPELARLRKKGDLAAVPTPAQPLDMKNALARVLLTLEVREIRGLPPVKVKAHRAAAGFPGSVVADVLRVTRTIEVDTAVPGWHSTGLYAAPGERITFSVPEAAATGLSARIGAHKDRLWHKSSWSRVPEITVRVPLAGKTTEVANPWGGLVYLEPSGKPRGMVAVEIGNAVPAPLFVLGKTDPEKWREEIRRRPAPWAELATKKVIVTVPSAEIRELADPRPVLALWDEVMDACADLAARPRDRLRPERYVADVQISAGYMHAGYPIMTHLDAASAMVSEKRLKAGNWGLFHEMGHNHQHRDWTFSGTTEVTCNLFSLYVLETVCGKEREKTRGNFPPPSERIKAYLATGPDFEAWKKQPFLALTMYFQLVQAFGWDPLKEVFAEYRALPAAERPKNDAEKRDQWLVRLSKTVGRNLGPFFTAWGVPTSEAARGSIAKLPPWMPEGFPPE